MACETVITNVPPTGQAKPASRHNGGGFVRFENCGTWDFWIHDVNANCNSIYNLAKINCIPLIDFLTTPLQVDVDANGHTIYNVGKIFIGSSTDDGSGALLQVNGEINAKSYMLGGYEFASYATPGQIDLTNIYSINGKTGFLPSGIEGSIQFNDDGNLKGDAFLVYDEITHNVGIVPLGLGPQWRLDVGGDINIIDPTYTGYAYRINGIPFAIADAGGSHINLINIGLINGAPVGGGGGGGALPGGNPGNVQFNVTGGLFGGSNNFFWDNTNNRLGIGTASPQYPLDVVGNENITGCYYIAQVPFACQSGSGIALQNIVTINGGPPGGAATLPGAPSGSVQFNQNNVFTGSANLTWDWINNRLGIGTFAPGYPLDVVGNVNARGCYLIAGLTFACSDGAGGINLTNITNINGQPPGTGGGGASVIVGDTPPATPVVGDLWFDSVGTQLYIWYQDPNSSQWVATINQCTGGSSGGTPTLPAPPNKSIQWNNGGAFGGSQGLLWDDGNSIVNVSGDSPAITFQSTTDNGDGTFSNITIAAISNGTTDPTLIPYADSSVIMTQNGMELFLASADAISMIPGAAGFYAVPITTGTGGYALTVDYATTFVGIRTVTPINTLDVLVPDTLYTAPSTSDCGVRFALSEQNTADALYFGVSSSNYAWIQSMAPGISYHSLLLNPNGGNVGIGIANPQQALDVNGNVRCASVIGSGTSTAAIMAVAETSDPRYEMSPNTFAVRYLPGSGAIQIVIVDAALAVWVTNAIPVISG